MWICARFSFHLLLFVMICFYTFRCKFLEQLRMKCGKVTRGGEKTAPGTCHCACDFCVCEHHQLGWYGLNNRGLCLYSAGIKCKSINYLSMKKNCLRKFGEFSRKINSNEVHTHSAHTMHNLYGTQAHFSFADDTVIQIRSMNNENLYAPGQQWWQ